MELVEVEITLPDDFKAFVELEIARGRYLYVDEAVVHAFYLLAQELNSKGFTSPGTNAVLARPLEQTLAEFRQALTKKKSKF